MSILNSPFVLLVAGAAISGLLVQWIAGRWQHRNWVSQQEFTAQRARFEKELDQKHTLLEDTNEAVAAILTHCQLVVVGHQKGVGSEQRADQIRRYNEAVMKWEIDFQTCAIRLKAFFEDEQVAEDWDSVKKGRDNLDVKIYELTSKHPGSPADCYHLIGDISKTMVKLSKRMLAEIDRMKMRPFESSGGAT